MVRESQQRKCLTSDIGKPQLPFGHLLGSTQQILAQTPKNPPIQSDPPYPVMSILFRASPKFLKQIYTYELRN
jgi:hypothetical protein